MPRQAALYCRSSKDRSAISIQAQRHELLELARSRHLIVTAEYADAVESGKDTDRPGFQQLLRDMKARNRAWSAVLVYDTSRIGRRRYIAEAFRHQCKKLGIDIVFAKVPEVDPISQVILDSVLQAMDEVHSLMSREKGLAGMAENVRSGYRAGGRAPYGYRLVTIDTGQVRDGQAVTKSRLEPDPATSQKIAAWLQGRAQGKNGSRLAELLGIELAKSSLAHLEWSALTYAGHTVWNMHRGKEDSGDGRRRPRSDWIIQRDTHQALITNDNAEAILTRLEGKKAERDTRARISDYLLAGLVQTPDGRAWHGNSGNYRVGTTNIRSTMLEEAVVQQVAFDLRGDAMIVAMTERARCAQQPGDGQELQATQAELRDADRRIARLTSLIEETDTPGPLLRRIEELERGRDEAAQRLQRLEEETRRAKALATVKESDVRRLLDALSEDLAALDREHLKDFLAGMIEAISLDPDTRAGEIRYRIGASGVKVASPRGTVTNPILSASVPFHAPRNRRAA
jgi:DNA invertase Pin-like site-specific DNA recombinase